MITQPASMDLLAIESFWWRPHLETAAEICLAEAAQGKTVGFAFLTVDNPDQEGSGPSWRARLLGVSAQRRVDALRHLLTHHGVRSISESRLPTAAVCESREFAREPVRSFIDLLNRSYKDARLGYGVASSLIDGTGQSAPDVMRFAERIARDLRVSAEVFERARALIDICRPTSVLTFNGRFACSKPIVEAARLAGVSCLVHERGAVFDRYDVQPDSIHDLAQHRRRLADLWSGAPDDRENTAHSFFGRRRSGDGIGWRGYTARQVEGSVPARRLPRRVVYFMTNDDEIAAITDALPHTLFPSQQQAVEHLVQWARRRSDVEFVIRLHPDLVNRANEERHFWEALSKGSPNVQVDPPDSQTDSYALAESADLVLTYGSTMGVESAYMGRPVILLCDSLYAGLGCVYEPRTLDELDSLLAAPQLAAKPREACLPFGYYSLTYGTPYRFYQPTSLFDGTFLGHDLSFHPEYLRRFKATAAGRHALKLWRAIR